MKIIEDFLKKYPLLDILLVLCFISCFAILNAAPIMYNIASPYTLWIKQLLYYIIGAGICFGVYKAGKDTFYNNIKVLYWTFMILLIILGVDHQIYSRLGISIVPTQLIPHINGATSWYTIPGFSFQPSEFMKIFMVVYLAKMTAEYWSNNLIRTTESEIKYIWEVFKIAFPPAFLILLQNDSGVMLIFASAVFFILLSSGLNRKWFIFVFTLIGVVIAVMAYLFVYYNGIFTSIIKGHTLNRVYGWLDPEGTTGNQGMQLWFSYLSYGTGSWFGHGFQAIVKKFPEAQTDFIFAVITTNYGYIAGFITLASIIALDVTLLRIGLKSENLKDKHFTMGIIGCLIFQQVWNIGMILGLLPITGITLPFLSYGGSSLLSYMIAIGFFLDMDYQNKITDTSHKNY